jgi:hypothetical protein
MALPVIVRQPLLVGLISIASATSGGDPSFPAKLSISAEATFCACCRVIRGKSVWLKYVRLSALPAFLLVASGAFLIGFPLVIAFPPYLFNIDNINPPNTPNPV